MTSVEPRADQRADWYRRQVAELHRHLFDVRDGAVATYIPELARVDPDRFGVAIETVDGRQLSAGDADVAFTIQSIVKLVLYGLALEAHGRRAVLDRVGVEPSGDRFNSIVLDEATNRPFNPMVNAGAIAVADLVPGADLDERRAALSEALTAHLGRLPQVDEAVWRSESTTGHRNRAIAHLMLSHGMIADRVEETLELYFWACSVLVTTRDLAVLGATLANGGVNPVTGVRALSRSSVRDVLSVALTCGMYDYSGEWVYSVGLPAKSGVGGGIVAVLPGEAGIATFSPRLDAHGNSVRGVRVLEELSERFDLHLFDADRPWRRT